MALLRRWLLILSAFILGGAPLCAASQREERAFAVACAALQDKFYERAETGFTLFLQNYRQSSNAPQVVLLLAQAQYHLGKFTSAIARLTDTNNLAKAAGAGLSDQYLYWTGEARFAAGDFPGAADTLVSLPDRFPKSPLGVNAVVEAATALGKLADWPGADAVLDNTNSPFQRAARLDSANPIVADGRLMQAYSKFEQRNFVAVTSILDRLDPAALRPEQDWKRAYLLCGAHLGLNNFDAALGTATNLLQIARQGGIGWAANLGESVVLYASLLEREGRLADAAAAWRENLTNGAPVEFQQQAVLKTVELAAAQNNLAEAELGLESYLAQFPAAASAELARQTLGELHLKDFIVQPAATNHLAAALTNLDQFLATYTNSPLRGRAFLDRGWCFWLTTNYPVSLACFQSAAQLLPESEDLAAARFKMGDAQFAQQEFAGAQTNYQAVLTDFAGLTNVVNSLADRALYQLLRVYLALTNTAGLDEAMRPFLGKFFTNTPADSSLLLAGQGFSSFGLPAKAREVFLGFQAERVNSPLLPQVAFATARTFERELDWPAAVTHYEAWLQTYPTNELRPQVEYARDWAVSQTGDEGRAVGLFTNFTSCYTNHELAPLALWWVADHYFRSGTNFVDAERNYQTIFQIFPANELAERAQLMAGRAAMGRFGYPEAIRYLTQLISDTNCPGDLRDQARFAYSEAKLSLFASETNNASLQDATNILAQMYPEAGTNLTGALAWCETGDLDLQMGAVDAATNAYAQALAAPVLMVANLPPDAQALCAQAQVRLGLALEKKAEKAEGLADDARKAWLDLAMQCYQNVFYSDAETKDEFWTKKAGLQMLALAARTGGLKGKDLDEFVSRLEEKFPQSKASLELKRLGLAP